MEGCLGCQLPKALRALWSCCGGQEPIMMEHSAAVPQSLFWGALGGYSVYDVVQSMRLAPVRKTLTMVSLSSAVQRDESMWKSFV